MNAHIPSSWSRGGFSEENRDPEQTWEKAGLAGHIFH